MYVPEHYAALCLPVWPRPHQAAFGRFVAVTPPPRLTIEGWLHQDARDVVRYPEVHLAVGLAFDLAPDLPTQARQTLALGFPVCVTDWPWTDVRGVVTVTESLGLWAQAQMHWSYRLAWPEQWEDTMPVPFAWWRGLLDGDHVIMANLPRLPPPDRETGPV